ncbi:DUF5681 domain-containing protein [Beijerinckia sp. L45]|uniref:DUF5681 domain-containing protein n=1 Tax=Beijerinckia sp. L45 TaxID=1641855 RepID=UPI00131DC644|nr:DUF5681 domain-containing protein [Beijerinckia sp. L45]
MAKNKDEGGSVRPGKVGYGRPPEEHRFRKGDPSPNPYGCRGKPKDASIDKKSFLSRKVTVMLNGEQKRVTRDESLFIVLYAQASKGDVKAIRYLDERCAAAARRDAERRAVRDTVADDDASRKKVIDNALNRRLKEAKRAGKRGEPDDGLEDG